MIVEERECSLLENPQTVQLWIQHIEYVEVCRKFIRAARASDWTLHSYSAGKMINLFTATRYHNYANLLALMSKSCLLCQKSILGCIKKLLMKICVLLGQVIASGLVFELILLKTSFDARNQK